MSAEVTPQGIRVNCIHPGLIDTPMTSWVMNDAVVLPQVLAQISLGRAASASARWQKTCEQSHAPRRFTSTSRVHCSSVSSRNGTIVSSRTE